MLAHKPPKPSRSKCILERPLFRCEKRVTAQKQRGQGPHERANFAIFGGADFDEVERDEAEAETGGNAEREWRGKDREEGGESFGEVIPTDAGDLAAHERADERACPLLTRCAG